MRLSIFKFCLLLSCSLLSSMTHAKVITIAPNTIIDKDTRYQSTTLDLSNGSFVISNHATLTIENSKIVGTISPKQNYLIQISNGKLNFRKNSVNIITSDLTPNPLHPPLYYAIKLLDGTLKIDDNEFSIDQPYMAGLFTTAKYATQDIIFTHNKLHNLHGGISLSNSRDALIANNKFDRISSSNILIVQGTHHTIKNNTFIFSGNNNVGDAIDLFDSNNIDIYKNHIFSGSCYSMVILLGKNIMIDFNDIVGGITYAIYISTLADFKGKNRELISRLVSNYQPNHEANENIVITNNYLAQNRFGLAASKVDGLTVKCNHFIQHFQDKISRRFWTNNDNLFQAVSHITWEDNHYKEAYDQNILDPDQGSTTNWVTFPLHGGIIL